VLDPWISYKAIKDDFKNNSDLSIHLEMAKADLREYFKDNYPSLQAILASRSLPQHPFLLLHHHHLQDHLKRISLQDFNASALLQTN